MSDQPISGLTAAKCQVMAELRSIPKTGTNDFHRYSYATEADFLRALRPLMAIAGLSIRPKAVAIDRVPMPPTKAGKEQWLSLGLVTYELRHTSGETEEIVTIASGIDGEDKGAYKALTGAYKYALRQAFAMSTGDDPEADKPIDNATDHREFAAALRAEGVDVARVDAWLAETGKPSSLDHGPDGRHTLFTAVVKPGGEFAKWNKAPAEKPKREAKPKEAPEDKAARQEKHHAEWEANKGRFFADLKALGIKYDDLCAWQADREKPRPSAMAPAHLGKLIEALAEGAPKRAELEEWLHERAERAAIQGEGA